MRIKPYLAGMAATHTVPMLVTLAVSHVEISWLKLVLMNLPSLRDA